MGRWAYTSPQLSTTWTTLAPMTPPMMAQTAMESTTSGSICFRGAQRATSITAVATATKLNRPCQLSVRVETKSVENRKGLMFISIMVCLPRRFYGCSPPASRK